jgi:16S rRNA processing protein RimM
VASFTADPGAIADYGPLTDEQGLRRFAIELLSSQKGQFLARVAGVADRDAAAGLAGTRLFVERDRLPEPDEDEFYHTDLIGLVAERPDGETLGRVTAVHDFGAGELIEIALETGRRVLVPFTRAAVPEVDPKAGRLVVDPPPGLLDAPDESGSETPP